jgi:hypothetical protein
MDRYAITFPIRPGASAQVAELLSGYPSPELHADAGARLLGTTVFLHDDTVVRVLDVEGPLPVVARHLAQDPVIAQVERELNPYLVTPREFGNPDSARRFFANALMTPLTVRVAPGQALTHSQRYALVYPIRPGTGDAADAVFREGGDPPAASGPPAGATKLLGTAVFRKDDFVIRVFDIDGDYDEAVDLLARARPLQEAGRRLRPYLQPGFDISDEPGLRRFLRERRMQVVTDRRAPLALGSPA